jgi:hypothetical protein
MCWLSVTIVGDGEKMMKRTWVFKSPCGINLPTDIEIFKQRDKLPSLLSFMKLAFCVTRF